MNESDVSPEEIAALQALAGAAQTLLEAARTRGNVQTEAIAAASVSALGLINLPPGGSKEQYLKRVAEVIFELAVAAGDAPEGVLS